MQEHRCITSRGPSLTVFPCRARISLLSKSDIRYVGTLHEINGENSTVALEQVVSFGTEGRRGNPDDEIAAADSVYEYIVFKGSDVKDLRVEEAPQENVPPQVPDDPAILGVSLSRRVSLPGLLLMKHFGCKSYNILRERKTVWIFPLPSF